MQLARLERVKIASVAILVLVLGAGFLLGAVWYRKLDAHPVLAQPDGTPAAPAGGRSGRRPLYVKVNPPLTPEQLTSAEGVVARRREAVRSLLAEPRIDSLYQGMKSAEREFKDVYNPRFRALVDSSRAAIRQIMTAEQARQYDSLLADSDNRRRQQAGGDPD